MPDHWDQEPPTGSVVAIDWGGPHQEIWVSNSANVGNWYTPDAIVYGHPHWEDVVQRAAGRPMTLLAAADKDAYAAGYDAGVSTAAAAVERAIEGVR